MNIDAREEADRDLSCVLCLGAGELCSECERPPLLCSCGAPALERCGLCGGIGDDGSII